MSLYNSTFRNPGKPMRARSLLKPSARARSGKTVKVWKSAKPKMTPIRASARGEDCTINLPMACNGNSETVVWCHENSYEAGKGMGLKARDERGAYGCSACHAVYDGQAPRPAGLTKEQVDASFYIGMYRSREILRRKGLLGAEK